MVTLADHFGIETGSKSFSRPVLFTHIFYNHSKIAFDPDYLKPPFGGSFETVVFTPVLNEALYNPSRPI